MEELLTIISEVGAVVAVALILSSALFQLARTLQPLVEALMQTVSKLNENVDKTQKAIDRYTENERVQNDLLVENMNLSKEQAQVLQTALDPIVLKLDALNNEMSALKQALVQEYERDEAFTQKLETLNTNISNARTDILQAIREMVGVR